MLLQVLKLIRLPLLMIFIYATLRFIIGIQGVPYAPRGNAMFSVVGVSLISSIYFGAISHRAARLSWTGTILTGVLIGLFSQILIFTATFLSYVGNLNTYYVHWDALNVPEGTVVPMAKALQSRLGGLIGGPVINIVMASVGRLLSVLLPDFKNS